MKSIKITDNGIGISPSKLPILLKPFSTDKRDDEDTIGEKGVGLTFVMFSGNEFLIKSGNNEGARKGTICNAYSWKISEDNEPLNLELESIDENFKGTEVKVGSIQNNNIFNLNFNQLKFILRTKTALGSSKSIWEDDRNIFIELIFRDINGKEHRDDIPFLYYLPYENLPPSAKIDFDDFITFTTERDRTDLEKRNKLRNKGTFSIT